MEFRFVSYRLIVNQSISSEEELFVTRVGVRRPFTHRVRVTTPEDLGRVVAAYEAARKEAISRLADELHASPRILPALFRRQLSRVQPTPLRDGYLTLKNDFFGVRVFVKDRLAYAFQHGKSKVSTCDQILLLFILGTDERVAAAGGKELKEALAMERSIAFEVTCRWGSFEFRLRVGPLCPSRVTSCAHVIARGAERCVKILSER